jgi:hypothetical protein
VKQPESPGCRSYLPHTHVKKLRLKLREGNPQAASELLLHSLRAGHRRLSVHRYLTAYALSAEGLDEHLEMLRSITKKLKNGDIRRISADVASKLKLPKNVFEPIEQLLLNKEGKGEN